ncbi:unnamed protein product [Arabidopsis halleri]
MKALVSLGFPSFLRGYVAVGSYCPLICVAVTVSELKLIGLFIFPYGLGYGTCVQVYSCLVGDFFGSLWFDLLPLLILRDWCYPVWFAPRLCISGLIEIWSYGLASI